MSPHVYGIAGELLNFVGGIFLASDVLLRQKQRVEARRLSEVKEFITASGLQTAKYKGFNITEGDFVEAILDQRVTRLGWTGGIFLLVGFLLLALYHYLEI